MPKFCFTFRFFASSASNCGNIAIFDHHRDIDRLSRGNTNSPNDMWHVASVHNVRTLQALRRLKILHSMQNKNAMLVCPFRGIECERHRHAHDFGHRLRLSSLNWLHFFVASKQFLNEFEKLTLIHG